MSEAVSSKSPRAGRRWLDIVSRILVALLMLLAVFGLISSVAGIAGVWYARSNARNAVIDVTNVTTKTLMGMLAVCTHWTFPILARSIRLE